MSISSRDVLIIGAGGFARETLDVIEALNSESACLFNVVGVTDNAPSEEALALVEERGIAWLGTDESWIARGAPMGFVVAVGDPRRRRDLAKRYSASGFVPTVLIHPRAVLGTRVTIGPGSVVCAGAQVSTKVAVGSHVHLNPAVIVGHDAKIGDYTSVNPGAIISGGVQVAEGVLVGAGAVVLERLRVGKNARVGAAACVVRNVDDGQTVMGVPAR